MFYGAGASANAAKIATKFGATASALASLPAGHVEVLLGTGLDRGAAGLARGVRLGRDHPRRPRRPLVLDAAATTVRPGAR